jgi:hypothetical protein
MLLWNAKSMTSGVELSAVWNMSGNDGGGCNYVIILTVMI